MADHNIAQLVGLLFGSSRYTRPLDVTPDLAKAEAFRIDDRPLPPALETGLLGTPIQLPCRLDGVRLPNEPLITLSGTKRVVMTEVDGNDGTFKELYSRGDMEVLIQGVAVNDNDQDEYPEDQVRAIRNLIEQPRHLRITNRLTALWNIEFVTVLSYSFPAVPGEIGMQGYELRCVSDRDFQLRLRTR